MVSVEVFVALGALLALAVLLVEAKEMASKAFNSGSVSDTAGISDYRRNQRSSQHPGGHPPSDEKLKEKLAMKGKCSECNKVISVYRKFQSGKLNK